ncbi:NRT1/ PTR family 8.2-like protein [Tanacetum coccineum]
MTLLTISAAVPGLKPTCISKENCHSTSTDIAITYLALYLVALGTGGIKPCASSYGADQFDDSDEVEKKHKSSFFTWFYLSINVGSLIASTLLVWIQDNVGWGWGFGIPAVTMALAVVSFFSGTRLYRNQKPGGSPLTRICQVIMASWRKRTLRVPGDKSALYETTDIKSAIVGSRKLDHTEDLSFLDKAAMELQSDHDKGSADPWRLCTDEKLNPKISDFGLARNFQMTQELANTTGFVYMSPEYAMGGVISEKSDVFSYWVMLLEIVSGKKEEYCLYTSRTSLSSCAPYEERIKSQDTLEANDQDKLLMTSSNNKNYGKWRSKGFNKESKESMKWQDNPNERRASTSQGNSRLKADQVL